MDSPVLAYNALSETQDTCEECGSQFVKRRKWQRFCGNNCRQRFHHRPHRTAELLARIEALEAEVAEIRHLLLPVR